MAENQSKWHVDKTVNVSVAFGFVCATASGIWFAAGITNRVETLEKQMAITTPLAERIIRLETKMDGVTQSLQEIKQLIRTPISERR